MENQAKIKKQKNTTAWRPFEVLGCSLCINRGRAETLTSTTYMLCNNTKGVNSVNYRIWKYVEK